MQSKAATVREYLDALPPDRRKALEALRKAIRANLDAGYEEGMQYGMIGYYVPHRVYPPGYHCDPKQPLPFAGLASQKNHMSLYLMSIYAGGEDTEDARWFRQAWTKDGRKLDAGKACVRFKKLEDVPLDVVGEAVRRLPARAYIARYEAGLGRSKGGAAELASRAKASKKPKASKAKPASAPAREAGEEEGREDHPRSARLQVREEGRREDVAGPRRGAPAIPLAMRA